MTATAERPDTVGADDVTTATTVPASTAAIATTARWDLFRVVLVVTVLTTVWRVHELVPGLGALRVPMVALLGLAALLLISPREQHLAARASRSAVMVCLYLLLVSAVLSVPTSVYAGQSGRYLMFDLLPAVLVAVGAAAAMQDLTNARRLAALQVAGATFYAVIILASFDIGEDGRLGDLIYYDANDIGMLMVCTVPLALYFVSQAATLTQRLLAMSALTLFLAMIAKSGSRGAFLALIAVALHLLLRTTTVHWSQRLGTLAAVAVLFVASTGAQYWTAVGTILTPTSDYNWIGNAESGRMAVWGRGIGYMQDRPLTGVGLNAFPIAEGTISPLADRQMFGRPLKWSAAHSSYVQVGAELGVLALVLFLGMLIGAYVVATRLARDAQRFGATSISALSRALAAGLVGYAVAGAFLSQAYAPFLLLTVGMIVGLDVSTRRGWRAMAAG